MYHEVAIYIFCINFFHRIPHILDTADCDFFFLIEWPQISPKKAQNQIKVLWKYLQSFHKVLILPLYKDSLKHYEEKTNSLIEIWENIKMDCLQCKMSLIIIKYALTILRSLKMR